jgi:hypothetical protein
MNDFQRDDKWQLAMRDAYLVPFYQRSYSGFLLFDDGRFARHQQEAAIDTLVWRADRIPVAIEEKIVRAPPPERTKPYDAICLETDSSTSPGFFRSGWMVHSRCDVLLYCLHWRDDSLDCLWIDFPALHQWFWPREKNFPPHRMRDTINMSVTRVVPIVDIIAAVPVHRFRLSRQRSVIPIERAFGADDFIFG